MAAAVANPVSVPTGLGAREVVDLASTKLNFQRLENPQTSIHQCGTKYGSQVVRSIFEKLRERDLAPTFEELNLSDNKIGDEGALFLEKGFAGSNSLKKLILPRANVGAEGFKAIGRLLADNTSIEEVVLSSNICDAEGLQGDFSAGLSKNKTLKSLYLGVCRLGDKGIEPLCTGPMRQHPTLEHLSLTYNRLEAPCVTYLSDMLSHNTALRYLDLSGNSLGPSGAEALVQGLKANKRKLEKLSVAQNVIRLPGARALAMFFLSPDGQHMQFMDLRHNSVTYKGMIELRKEVGKPMDDSSEDGWLLLYGERQLFLNAH
mmetsp:Transcript_77407/g.215151  ORF Transcript_77407/g.215151 Transcript_77407/m.215151 type:complete len:318 (+) Transcript_77407:87-1040(+)